MNIFCARLDLTQSIKQSDNSYNIIANVIDNSGNFYATTAQVNNIIYLDGSSIGAGVLRYVINSINSTLTTGANLYANISWNMTGTAVDAFSGQSGIIGSELTNSNNIAIPGELTNSISDILISEVNNYEKQLLATSINSKETSLGIPTSTAGFLSSTITGVRSWNALATVATTGSYSDLKNTPTISTTGLAKVASTGSFLDLLDIPQYAAVAYNGNYGSLVNIPSSIPVIITKGQNTFNSTGGVAITFTVAQTTTNYTVYIQPSGTSAANNPGVNLGSIYVLKNTTGFTVFNSGISKTTFDFIVLQ